MVSPTLLLRQRQIYSSRQDFVMVNPIAIRKVRAVELMGLMNQPKAVISS
jgi:hypothetical protein